MYVSWYRGRYTHFPSQTLLKKESAVWHAFCLLLLFQAVRRRALAFILSVPAKDYLAMELPLGKGARVVPPREQFE